jgi:hypothetical protein
VVLVVLLFAFLTLVVAWILCALVPGPVFPLSDGVICVLASLVSRAANLTFTPENGALTGDN